MRTLSLWLAAATLASCGVDSTLVVGDSDSPLEGAEEVASTDQAITCAATMSVFPVGAQHNIGYDAASCGSGTCRISCPDQNANSDWNGAAGHHGIDIFAFHRAPLVAVSAGTVVAVGTPSGTSGLRVRLRDRCGWEYYYGHMNEAVVRVNQTVSAGQLLGYMGRTGTASTHLHFNIAANGNYSSDINPFNLLKATSPTACAAPPEPEPQPQPQPAPGCGTLASNTQLGVNESVASCDGRFTLVMQGDGNLVLYQQGFPIWHTATNGRGGARAAMQGDGNFVLYTASNGVLFHTFTNGRPGAYLAVQNDGNLVVYQGGVARWNSGTCCR